MLIRIQRLVLGATLLFTFLMSSESRAEPRGRDGFYVQLTTGFGLSHFAVTADDTTFTPTDHYASSERGVSTDASLLLGLPLRPGIVLGAGGIVSLSLIGVPSITRNGQPYILTDVSQSPFQLMDMVGPFVDIYPSPTLGWHLQALVGYAQITFAEIAQHPLPDASNPSGIGLVAGVGHDWWVNDHWSIGLLARVTYANVSLGPTPNGIGSISEHNTLVSPSLEASFTSH
jgi:hypothetical protein